MLFWRDGPKNWKMNNKSTCFLSYFLGDVPKEEAAEKEESRPVANQNKVSVRTITRQTYLGNFRGTRWLTLQTSLEWSRWGTAEWNKHSQKLQTSYLLFEDYKAKRLEKKEDKCDLWNPKVPSLREEMGFLWLPEFWVCFSLLLLSHTHNLDLDMLLLQTISSVRTGTKGGPAYVVYLPVADPQAVFLGQRSNVSFWLQSSKVLEGWHCINCFFLPHKTLL